MIKRKSSNSIASSSVILGTVSFLHKKSFVYKVTFKAFIDNVFRRLKNFEQLLELKMDKFSETKTYLDAKPRLVFLMTYDELVKKYEERQKKKQSMKHITSGFKLTATIALLSLCIFLVYALYSFKTNMEQSYTKRKAAKEKRKRRAKKKKRKVL